MKEIELPAQPNMAFSYQTDNALVTINLHTFRDLLYCSISQGNRSLINGIRCVPDHWILPACHSRDVGGNFRFETTADHYPKYSGFGDGTTRLLYYSNDEIED